MFSKGFIQVSFRDFIAGLQQFIAFVDDLQALREFDGGCLLGLCRFIESLVEAYEGSAPCGLWPGSFYGEFMVLGGYIFPGGDHTRGGAENAERGRICVR